MQVDQAVDGSLHLSGIILRKGVKVKNWCWLVSEAEDG